MTLGQLKNKSFAIVVSKNIELKPGQIMKMRYKGLISDEAQPRTDCMEQLWI